MYRGWIQYFLPSIFMFMAILMLWRRHLRKGRPLEAFIVTPPPNRNAVEQLLTLQEAITQFESLIQAANIILLKLRALLLAILPQVSIQVILYFYKEKFKCFACSCRKHLILCIHYLVGQYNEVCAAFGQSTMKEVDMLLNINEKHFIICWKIFNLQNLSRVVEFQEESEEEDKACFDFHLKFHGHSSP